MTDGTKHILKSATLRDVAREAGVSLMTVSNVVNGNFCEMRPETRARVEETIRKLQYRPRGMARGLRLAKNFAVGLLIVDPISSFLSDPFISQVVAGASNYLGEKGYGCLVHGVAPDNFEESIFFSHSRVDGICTFLSGSQDMRHTYIERLHSLGVPVVGIEEPKVVSDSDYAIVYQDDFGAAVKVTDSLLQLGCRFFVVLAPTMPWPSVTERIAGIRHRLEQESLGATLKIIDCGTGTIEEAKKAFASENLLLSERCAMIGASDRLSLAAARISNSFEKNRSRPRLAAFSASESTTDLSVFEVIANSEPFEIGKETGRMIISRLDNGAFPTHEAKVPVSLNFRPGLAVAAGE